MPTNIEISSNALVLIGDTPISSLDPTEGRGAEVCAQIFDQTYISLLAGHPWRFSVEQAQLNQLTTPPLFTTEFTYAYQLPVGFLRIITTEGATNFKIYKDQIYSNASPLKLEFQVKPDIEDAPTWFVQALTYRLASLLALAVGEDDSKHRDYDILARNELIKAKSIDSQSEVNDQLIASDLIDVRNI